MIRFAQVGVAYKGGFQDVLRGITLQIHRGEFVFLVGHTGAGKSTLLRLLYRDVHPTTGHIFLNEREITNLPERDVPLLRRGMGVVFQDFGLLPQRTVWENVAFAGHVIGTSPRDVRRRTAEVLRMVGLMKRCDAYPYELSAGEQQRTAIARAFMNKPDLILADEPTGNLDPKTSADIMEIFLEANSRGATVLIATHDKIAVDALRKRVIALENGRIVRNEDSAAYGFHRSLFGTPLPGIPDSAEAANPDAEPPLETPTEENPADSASAPEPTGSVA